jgi:hypothetical protein
VRRRLYVGHPTAWDAELFWHHTTPTHASHGKKYKYVMGPFRTKEGADFYRKYHRGNPHLRTVDDAERLARHHAHQERRDFVRTHILHHTESQRGHRRNVDLQSHRGGFLPATLRHRRDVTESTSTRREYLSVRKKFRTMHLDTGAKEKMRRKVRRLRRLVRHQKDRALESVDSVSSKRFGIVRKKESVFRVVCLLNEAADRGRRLRKLALAVSKVHDAGSPVRQRHVRFLDKRSRGGYWRGLAASHGWHQHNLMAHWRKQLAWAKKHGAVKYAGDVFRMMHKYQRRKSRIYTPPLP